LYLYLLKIYINTQPAIIKLDFITGNQAFAACMQSLMAMLAVSRTNAQAKAFHGKILENPF